MPIGHRTLAECLTAALLGLVLAFFVAFNVVFSDVFGWAQRLGALAFVLAAYGLAGALVAVSTHGDRRLLATLVAAPAIVLVAAYSLRETGALGYHLAVLLCVVVGTFVGTFAMRTWRARRRGLLA